MDPDATLRTIVAALAKAELAYHDGNEGTEAYHLRDAGMAVGDLLDWLAGGGFAPDWKAGMAHGLAVTSY